ncbi:translation initiation factor IF-2 [Limnoglobus roseus]|uniref:Translation initiation factor IF-2 n=1 Tax=Limnoglobus roseus TaxID=2598579 RepID=A0A5C1A8M4_9BACT|nr:translation initiation factor IF-2 [Limnoglobus roseus]QEL14543.1 translation initiation factor IF-2 [Limnoglobus roseus]
MSNTPTKEPKEKQIRVFELAKELNLESKQLLDYCKELGFAEVKNQLKGLSGDQVDALKDRSKKGPRASSPTAAPLPTVKATMPPPGKIESKIQHLPKAKVPAKPAEVTPPAPEPVAELPTPEPEPVVAEAPAEPEAPPAPEPVVAAPVVPPPPPKLPTFGAAKIQNLSGKAPPKPLPPKPVVAPPVATVPVVPPAAPAPTVTVPPVEQPTTPTPPAATVVPSEPTPPVAAPAAVSPPPTAPAPLPPQQIQRQTLPPTVSRPGVPTLGSSRPPQPGAPRPIMGPGNNPARPMGSPPQPGAPRPPQQGPGGPAAGPRPPQGPGGPRQIGSNPGRGPGHGPGHAPAGGPPKPHTGKGPPMVAPPKTGQPTKLTPEMLDKIRKLAQQGKRVDIKEIQKTGEVTTTGAPGDANRPNRGPGGEAQRPGGPPRPAMLPRQPGDPSPVVTEDDEKPKGPGGARVIGGDARHKNRQDRARQRGGSTSTDRNSVVIGTGGSVDMIEEKHGSRRGPRAALLSKLKRRQQQQVVKKEGPVEIAPPITVRSLSEAIGMKVGELSKRLVKETNKLYAVNSPVEFEVAELIAIEKGITLKLKERETAESKVLDKYKKRAEEMDPALAVTRPPIVTIMGHVDHGKTTLLDKIRQEYGIKSDVVSTEAGGITQVIRAWQVEKDGNHVTFLDTPGHEAFTKMRARGAKVTDIVVIVVAATDGVMPQTEEAISHAKAADVDIIVAINKIDMPNANVDKTRRQLYQLELLPDNMGGDVPFVETSATTGQGISELLEQVLLVAELADPPLKADPQHPGSGTCLEAYQDSDEGVKATLIVQQGTLHKGDILLCGSTFGRVRAMYNDMGVQIDEAGPSTPVKVTGLDEVPDADDPFYVVEDLSTAREIAEVRKSSRQRSALSSFTPISLDTFNAAKAAQKITELKVIIKAEARGSVEAIKKEMEKLVHEEVRVRVLHSGIGAINESDVELALTSPADTLVIGFNVTADDAALRLAEQRGVSLREYDIIYKLTDDVKSALEGKLKPIEEVVHLGRAVIRDTFKISKTGTIAGCYVTSGVIERSARVRVIRQGVVIFPPSEKVVGLDSLKRFKDDAKEVREGFECGMKITGFDDVKVDDVIEAFKIEIKYRTL